MRLGGCAAAIALLLAACHGGGHTPDTLPPTSSSTTPTTVDYSIPPVIDAPYVTKVMQALDHLYGDAARIMARNRSVNEEFTKHLAALYTDRFFRLARDAWTKDLAEGLPTLAPRPGDPRTTVDELLRADPNCVFAK